MSDQIKKISFGFSKLAKKTAIVSNNLNKIKQEDDASKVELIDCLEGKSIKLKDPVKVDQGPLIIPLTRQKEEKISNLQVNSEDVQNSRLKCEMQNMPTTEAIDTGNEESVNNDKTNELKQRENQNKLESLDEIAAREILEELNRKKTADDEKRVFSVPLTSNAPSGEKESSLEDYDNIPVTEFGMAMLRGMGWAPGKGIGKTEKLVAPTVPTLRPKGMGLGADKVIKSADKKSSNEELKMVKGSFVRVLAGPEKDAYGHIEGFDDESGRLIIRLTLKNISISLNEFMVQLVDTQEFNKNSKVINVSKYEKYKKDEVKKESSERKSQEIVYEKVLNKEPVSRSPSEKFVEKRSKLMKKNRSSSCESEEKPLKDSKSKSSSDSRSRHARRSSSRSSRSPYRRNESPSSQSRSHMSQSKKYETSSKHKSVKTDKKHRSYSSGSSSSSNSFRNRPTDRNKSQNSSKSKSPVKDRSINRRRSSSNGSTSSDNSRHYAKKKKDKHKKKKTSSNKYRSRSRSRSPRKHKHKKSKKYR